MSSWSGFQSHPFFIKPSPTAAAFARTVQPGDHVRVSRGIYSHHAIYIGDGWLIEFGSGIFGGAVAYVDWDFFAKGAEVMLVGSGGWPAVHRAKSQLGRNDFDLISRNCEHFASWCATGRWESGQVKTVATGAVAALLLMLFAKTAA